MHSQFASGGTVGSWEGDTWGAHACRQTGLQAGGFRECGGGGSQLWQQEGDCDLWTCSAPLDAVDPGGRRVDVVELWGEWCAHHRARAGCALEVWADLRFVDSRAGPQAVVL